MIRTRLGTIVIPTGVGSGLCECGCGEPAPIAKVTSVLGGYVKGKPRRFVFGHVLRGSKGVRPPARPHKRHVDWSGYRTDGSKREHIVIAERALGRPLPKGAEVHHVNRDRLDNSPSNLVVCQDHAYHMLLHRRQRALEACGNANWLKCQFCKRWDDPSNMTVLRTRPGTAYHKACVVESRKGMRGQ
jgi:hypothetical protein